MRLSAKLSIAMFLAAGILAFSVRGAAADQLGFAVDNTETLFSVDLTTATATPIGFTGQFLQGLAVSPQGSLFGTDYLGNLYSVSKTTGAATFIGSTGLGDIEGLTFRGTTLIGTDFSNLGGLTTVSAINSTTAAATPIGLPIFGRGQSPDRHQHDLGAAAEHGCGSYRRAQFRNQWGPLCPRPVRKRVHDR